MRFNLTVIKDGGERIKVVAGQRELAAWEREPFGCASTEAGKKSPVLWSRYLAFAALKRQWRLDHIGGQPATFEAWSDTVEEVEFDDDEEGSGEDPTKTGQSPPA